MLASIFWGALAIMLVTAGVDPARAGLPDEAPNSALGAVFEEYWQASLRLDPARALAVGDTRYEDRFDDSLEDAWRGRELALLDKTSGALAAFPAAQLTPQDRVSLDMLHAQLALAREYYSGALFETARRLPIDQFQGLHTAFAADAAGAGAYPFKTLDNYEGALARADNYARWTNDVIARLREGVRTGVVLPRLVVSRILPQLHAHFGLPAEATEFWRPIRQFPADFTAAERARLEGEYRTKITQVIEPAYQRLYRFLQDEYLARARASVGLSAVPGGAALYAYDVRFHTTTDLEPQRIHALGLIEVRRLEVLLLNVGTRLGFHGTLRGLLTHVRDDSRHRFGDRAAIVPAYEAARQRILARLPLLFDVMPAAEFEIRALPDSSRESQGNGYFAPAAAGGSRPGILWINTYAPGIADEFNVMTISLHEGLPGHHFQTALALEQTALPAFRRFDATNAYGEGWALYCESLGKELGLYDDPWSYYGYLNYAMLRANRLVIDTGLHAMGWDLAKSIAWMTAHSSMNRSQAAAEVERYVAYPGQALSYKIGEMKILELRRRAEKALGARFDLKAFHDRILLGGSMPLAALESSVDGWIESVGRR